MATREELRAIVSAIQAEVPDAKLDAFSDYGFTWLVYRPNRLPAVWVQRIFRSGDEYYGTVTATMDDVPEMVALLREAKLVGG